MRKIIGAALMLLAVSISSNADAGSTSGLITKMYAHSPNKKYGNKTGVVMFTISGEISEKPDCNTMYEWSFNINTDVGKAMYDLLLHASSEKLPVTVLGTGKCSSWSDRETVYWIQINP